MSNHTASKLTGSRPRGLQLCLRDQALLEGHVTVAAGQFLPSLLAGRAGWLHLDTVHVLNTGEKLPHTSIQTTRILWASSPNGDVALGSYDATQRPHPVELQLEGDITLLGSFHLAHAQLPGEYLAAHGPFLPLYGAHMVPGEIDIGDVAVNNEAVLRVRDVSAGDDVQPAPAASGFSAARVRDGAKRDGGGRHWLVRVAHSARLAGADELETAATLHIAAAWANVCERCGVDDDQLARLVAAHYRLGLAAFESSDPALTDLIPDRIARKYNVMPLREEAGHLVLATCDPTDHDAEQALRFASRKRPVFEIATPARLQEIINQRYSSNQFVETLLSSMDGEATDTVRVVQDLAPESVGDEDIDAAPIIKLTNVILRDAVRERASDIHIEPGAAGAVVRLRVDGVLRNHMQIPLAALTRVISRVKILADLDIADRLRPQDGRTKIQVDGHNVDLRISTVPTRGTEKCVVRVLSPEGNRRIEDVGAPHWEAQRLRQLLTYREGITVVTGPTGSGKTTTLYAALREVATTEVNVMSVEDPVEYELPGITQIQVEAARGVTFATALRAILRQDPDIIFVGEIRDTETAEVAVHAAMTGHLVLATLHTNDAIGAVARLAQLGIDPPSIAATLRGAVAQRLVRRLCSCARPVAGSLTTDEQRLAELYGAEPLMRAHGCTRCTAAGFKGRLPLFEVMVSNSLMHDLIAQQASTAELQRAAVAGGMRSLQKVGLERLRNGETTIQEIERVLGGARDEPELATSNPAAHLALPGPNVTAPKQRGVG